MNARLRTTAVAFSALLLVSCGRGTAPAEREPKTEPAVEETVEETVEDDAEQDNDQPMGGHGCQ